MMTNGGMIPIDVIPQIWPSSYVPTARPVTHSVVMPVATISLFVGFTDIIVSEDSARIRESPPHDRLSESKVGPIHRLASEYDSANSNVTETTVVANDAALNDDADSVTPTSAA